MYYEFTREAYNNLKGQVDAYIQLRSNNQVDACDCEWGFCLFKNDTEVYMMLVQLKQGFVYIGRTDYSLTRANAEEESDNNSDFVQKLGDRPVSDPPRIDTDYTFVYFEYDQIAKVFADATAVNKSVYINETPFNFRKEATDDPSRSTKPLVRENAVCSVDLLTKEELGFDNWRTDAQGMQYAVGKPCPPVWGSNYIVCIGQQKEMKIWKFKEEILFRGIKSKPSDAELETMAENKIKEFKLNARIRNKK